MESGGMKKNEIATKLWARRVTEEQGDRLEEALKAMRAGVAEKPVTIASVEVLPKSKPSFVPVDKEVEKWRDQARLQGERADGLDKELEEARMEASRLAAQMDEFLRMGGTEPQSMLIARLYATIAQLGGKKGEFDQE